MSKTVKRSHLKRQLWKVSLGKQCASQVLAYCDYFMTNKPDVASPLYSSLLTSICVVYAKPFTNNAKVGMLSDKFARCSSLTLQQLHRNLLRYRDNLYAHQNPDRRKLHIHVEAQDLGDTIQYRFTPQAEISDLDPSSIPLVAHICKELLDKLEVKHLELMAELFGNRHWPTGKFTLNLDDES